MSPGWIADSSVGLAWVHFSQATPETNGLLAEARAGTPVVVPALWFAEVANGLLVLKRRGKLTTAELKSCLLNIDSMSLTVDEPSIRAAVRGTPDLADAHGLTLYDATYLEAAIRLGLGLATRDVPLKRAAKACGVKTL